VLSRLSAVMHKLPRDSRDTLFLLAVIAWVLLPQTSNLPWWCSLLAGAVLLWRGWLAAGSRPLPGKAWMLLLLVITVGATWLTHRTLLGRDAGVTLIVILLTLKTLELRARRDAFVIFFLGFFSMLTNFFYSQSLLTAFSMLLGLLGLLTVLVNAHMPAGKPALLEAAKTASWMALLGAPIMLVLFLLFPRLAPLWGVPSDAMTGRSGLSASMQVGNIASLALDDSVALRIRFEGNTAPPQQDLYFRGPVLSDYDGKEWRPSRPVFSSRFSLTSTLVVSGTPVSYEVTMEPSSRPWLLVMDAAAQNPVLPGYQTVMGPDLQWMTNRPVADLVRYKVQSYTAFRHGPLQRVPGLQEFQELPAGYNPRTLALASQMRSDPRYAQADTQVLVQAVMERLRTGGYTYTLEPGVYGQNTADEFWFDRKEGFCEHIASSFVILMRALGVPARIVTGYQGGERNGVDGYWVIRQSDAHAWAEVWQAGRGWVRVDPTSAVAPGRTGAFQRLAAPQGVVAQTLGSLSPGLVTQLRATWEAVNNRWNQWVLNYTQSRQLDLLKNIGFDSPSWEDLGYVLSGIVVLLSLAGALWAWWDRTQHDPWLRLLSRARRQLEKRGLSSSTSTTPRQLALQVSHRYGVRAQPLLDWLIALEQQRYAATSTSTSSTLQQLKARLSGMAWPES
jgi:protein-glutamine gamma-glutamyltransferase